MISLLKRADKIHWINIFNSYQEKRKILHDTVIVQWGTLLQAFLTSVFYSGFADGNVRFSLFIPIYWKKVLIGNYEQCLTPLFCWEKYWKFEADFEKERLDEKNIDKE